MLFLPTLKHPLSGMAEELICLCSLWLTQWTEGFVILSENLSTAFRP